MSRKPLGTSTLQHTDQQLCLLHANCQGEALAALLAFQPDFAARYRVELIANYTRQAVPEAAFSHCAVLLHQHLSPEWGPLASDTLKTRLPREFAVLCIPNMFLLGPWPRWSSAPGFDYSDKLLDLLLGRGLSGPETLHLYLRTRLALSCGLDEAMQASLEREHAKQAHTPIPYLDFVLENWHTRPLFRIVNHPGPELMRRTTDHVLAFLELPALIDAQAEAAMAANDPLAGFELPVHPLVAAESGIAWAGENTLYDCYGHLRTCADYASQYVQCKRAGIDDFIGFLRLRAAS